MAYSLGSLFDGSGGFPFAGHLCGIEPKWASEIEPYPIAVTRSRFPTMKHLGDISKISGAEIDPVDIISFGSPCQDLSVAGKRAGLKHESNGDEETTRSGLFMEAVRIIKEMRSATNGQYPTFALWENVPGAFSSNKGEDFRIVLEELIKVSEPSAVMPAVPKKGWPYADSYCGAGWSLCYRTLDAQHWGVPQRRRRIYLVADFRGQRARKVLFERKGLRGYFETGRTQGKGVAGDAENCAGADDRKGNEAFGVDLYNQVLTGAVSKSMTASASDADHVPCAILPYMLKIRSGCEGGGKGALVQENKSATLATNNDQYLFQPVPNVCMATQQGGAEIRTDDKAPTITAAAGMSGNNQPVVAYSFDSLASNSMKSKNPHSGCRRVEVAKTLDTTDPNPSKNQGGIAIVERYLFENHSQDTRYKGPLEISPMLPAQLGTGGNNTPFVVEESNVYCLQGNGIDRADTAGCNGKGWNDETCYTLNTIDRPAVAYSIGNGQLNQTSMSETCNTLDCMHDKQAVLIKDAGVRVQYIVRRLTPTECARLQGFPDKWGHPEQKEAFSEEEYRFWLDVRNTHAAINGRGGKEYTKEQMFKWYNSLHTDSAEYKMWGNGIALPTALYVMQGISEAFNNGC